MNWQSLVNIKYDTIRSARNILSAQYTVVIITTMATSCYCWQADEDRGESIGYFKVSVFAPVSSLFLPCFLFNLLQLLGGGSGTEWGEWVGSRNSFKYLLPSWLMSEASYGLCDWILSADPKVRNDSFHIFQVTNYISECDFTDATELIGGRTGMASYTPLRSSAWLFLCDFGPRGPATLSWGCGKDGGAAAQVGTWKRSQSLSVAEERERIKQAIYLPTSYFWTIQNVFSRVSQQ